MFIGIDLGTSAIKALIADEHQSCVASVEEPLRPRQPFYLWSEDDPEAWWQAVEKAMDRLAAANPGAMTQVRGIGLSGQMHGAVLLDEFDKPVRPAILWNDGRSYQEAADVAAQHPGLLRKIGALPVPGFTGPKILWLERHEPATWRKIRSLMLPKDFLRLKLTGERATDYSDAAGTAFLDQAKRKWLMEAAEAFAVEERWLCRLGESTGPSGQIRVELAQRWGIPPVAVIAGGGGDAAVGGVGIGAIAEGDSFISLGTSAQFFVATSTYRPAPDQLLHAFCHSVPDVWYQMAVMLSGASAVAATARWLRYSTVEDLFAEVEASYRGPSEVMILPYLSGERTPHNNPFARGVVYGLRESTTSNDIALAALEGVAFMLSDALHALRQGGAVVKQVSLIGGGARSLFWTRLLASALDLPIARHEGANLGPAFGAARLGRLAATGEPVGNVIRQPSGVSVIEPDPRLKDHYGERQIAFRRLYKALEPEYLHNAPIASH